MDTLKIPHISYSTEPVLLPQEGVCWADTMVLNPSVIEVGGEVHMLFRATGPWPQAQQAGQPLPYPIFLGYARAGDALGKWMADFSRPALAPQLETSEDGMWITDSCGRRVINYANGCIEDPRLFTLDGKHYVTAACRLFAPGPYWENDDPMQCAPLWAVQGNHVFGRAASENLTVSVLYEVDLRALASAHYEEAFKYLGHLTDPQRGDNRDVVLFTQKMQIAGKLCYAQLHRPKESAVYGMPQVPPSIFIAASETLQGFPTDDTEHRLLASPLFDWEGDRIGASWTPLSLGDGEWLLPYHGKQDAVVGYTQSFMILRTGSDGWPKVVHRCPQRLMYAQQSWELSGRFTTPCLFTCGGIVRNGRLIMSYGAADTVCGIADVDFKELVDYVRNFDAVGNLRHSGV